MSKITHGSDRFDADRYKYDFKLCHPSKGWAQLDTKQDASYYGNWVNPTTLETFSYCEGDLTHVQYEDDAEFVAGIREAIGWHNEHGWGPAKIDGMCNDTIIQAFTRLGLTDVLH